MTRALRRRLARLTAPTLVAGLVLAGCADSEPDALPTPDPTELARQACSAAAVSVGDAVQRYVDAYAAPSLAAAANPSQSPGASTQPSPSRLAGPDADLEAAVADAQEVVQERGCDPEDFAAEVESALGEVTADGPVADAVLRQLRASLTGRAAPTATTRSVTPEDDLREVLAELPTGSTVELAPGTYALDEPLVVLRGVTLRGAGRDDTTIQSSSSEASVLVFTAERVELRELALDRSDERTGSVVVAGSAAALVVSGSRISGGTTDADGLGGAGILLAAGDTVRAPATSLEVTDTDFAANAGAGIAASGEHSVSIVGSRFSGSGQCGICFLDDSGGSVEASSFTDNTVGVAVLGSATPTLIDIDVTGGEVGIQAAGEAAPIIKGGTVTRAARAAVLLSEQTSGSVDGLTCSDVPFGIVVGPRSAPTIGDNACDLARSEN